MFAVHLQELWRSFRESLAGVFLCCCRYGGEGALLITHFSPILLWWRSLHQRAVTTTVFLITFRCLVTAEAVKEVRAYWANDSGRIGMLEPSLSGLFSYWLIVHRPMWYVWCQRRLAAHVRIQWFYLPLLKVFHQNFSIYTWEMVFLPSVFMLKGWNICCDFIPS